MIRKGAAVAIFGLAFLVFFVDELYRLRSVEWVPNLLGPVLIAGALYVWNPARFSKKAEGQGTVGENGTLPPPSGTTPKER